MTERVTYRLEEGVARISMNDGKVNVMSLPMLEDLDRAFGRAEAEARSLVLQSAIPGIFSAGFDLRVFAADDARRSTDMVRAGAELALRLLSLPIPTIGVMAGHAYPMGAFLLLACDFRIAASGPWRIGLNEVTIGITPPTFAVELTRSRLHPGWLSRTVTLGEMVEPADALAAGLVDRVVNSDDVEPSIGALLERLDAVHGPSHAAAKARLGQATVTAMRAAIDCELTTEAFGQQVRSVATPGSR